MNNTLRVWWKWEFIEMMLDRYFNSTNIFRLKNKLLFQALRLVNNRSLEDALAVVFGETPVFSADSTISTNGASIEQATQVSYESVGRIVFHKFS
jgi:hypothetical protein